MPPDRPTTAALLTPLAPGAIAVIGVRGPRTDEVLAAVLRRLDQDKPPRLPDNRPALCRLVDRREAIDDVVAVRICAGEEATAELNTHGGVRIAQRALLLLERQGVAIVSAEHFAERLSARDPIQRDVDRTLLGVTSRRLARWLLCQRNILPAWLARLDTVADDEREAFHGRSRVAIRLIQGLRIAVLGPPNAGKSTLANRLIGTDRVITSDRPGTTRDWVAETAPIHGWPVTLTDTAGIRRTACALESEAIRRSEAQARLADLVLIVLDGTLPASEQAAHLESARARLPGDMRTIIVQNKCDHPRFPPVPPAGAHACRVSALTGAGIDHLESLIESVLGLEGLQDDLPAAFLATQLPA